MNFIKHFGLVWKNFVRELKSFEYGQYFFVYFLIAIILFISSKDFSIVGKLQNNYLSLLAFTFLATIILIFTIPKDEDYKRKNKWFIVKLFGFIEKFGSIVFTGYGIMFWYVLALIITRDQWNESLFLIGTLFFMGAIKFFLSAIEVNEKYFNKLEKKDKIQSYSELLLGINIHKVNEISKLEEEYKLINILNQQYFGAWDRALHVGIGGFIFAILYMPEYLNKLTHLQGIAPEKGLELGTQSILSAFVLICIYVYIRFKNKYRLKELKSFIYQKIQDLKLKMK